MRRQPFKLYVGIFRLTVRFGNVYFAFPEFEVRQSFVIVGRNASWRSDASDATDSSMIPSNPAVRRTLSRESVTNNSIMMSAGFICSGMEDIDESDDDERRPAGSLMEDEGFAQAGFVSLVITFESRHRHHTFQKEGAQLNPIAFWLEQKMGACSEIIHHLSYTCL